MASAALLGIGLAVSSQLGSGSQSTVSDLDVQLGDSIISTSFNYEQNFEISDYSPYDVTAVESLRSSVDLVGSSDLLGNYTALGSTVSEFGTLVMNSADQHTWGQTLDQLFAIALELQSRNVGRPSDSPSVAEAYQNYLAQGHFPF